MSTSPVPERIIDRIRRIKALTESTNEHEAAVAAAKLTEMLQQHDLSLQDIPNMGEDPVVSDTWSDLQSRQLSHWRFRLSEIVASVTFCDAIYGAKHFEGETKRNRRIRRVVYFIGHKGDAEVAKYLYETLSVKVDELATKRTSDYIANFIVETGGADPWRMGGEVHPMVFRNSWMLGALSAIRTSLHEQYAQFEKSSANAKALIKVKDDAVATFIKKEFPKLGHFGSNAGNGNFNPAAYDQGKRDGSNIHAHRALHKSGSWQPQLGKGGAK